MIYLDTSALIKRFLVEPGSPLVYSLLTTEPGVATAKIAYAETYGVLTRKQRAGHLSRVQYALAARRFEEEWQVLTRIDLHDDILVLARELIQRHPLRAFDAIHLASAISLKGALEEDITFAAADAQLLRAAKAERLRPLDVENPPTSRGDRTN